MVPTATEFSEPLWYFGLCGLSGGVGVPIIPAGPIRGAEGSSPVQATRYLSVGQEQPLWIRSLSWNQLLYTHMLIIHQKMLVPGRLSVMAA